MDITYIPVQGGSLYLCCYRCLQSFCGRLVLSNTMTSNGANKPFKILLTNMANREILKTDQGSQFTAYEFCDWVTHPQQGIKLSMDGKGRAIDNIFIERLWRSVKYEHVYLFPASDGLECYRGVKEYFEYYNTQRRHQSLENKTPLTVYEQTLKQVA